jgi:cobalt-zinc-cadmium resistance protein CzcA
MHRESSERIKRDVPLPGGYDLKWGGQFENLQAATRRLSVETRARTKEEA